MNFEQAKQLSFLVPWKAVECHASNCWCRRIVTVEPILYTKSTSPNDEEEYIIADAGDLDQQTAEYIVKLHNEHHERVKQSCKDVVMKVDKWPIEGIDYY